METRKEQPNNRADAPAHRRRRRRRPRPAESAGSGGFSDAGDSQRIRENGGSGSMKEDSGDVNA